MVWKSKSKAQAGAVKIEHDDDNKAVPEDSWPHALQLRNGTLIQQTNLIHGVCCEAICIVKNTLVTQHAWLELHKGVHYKQEVLLNAVKVLCTKNIEDDEGKKDAQYKALNAQVFNDERFVRFIGKWVGHSPVTSQFDTLLEVFTLPHQFLGNPRESTWNDG